MKMKVSIKLLLICLFAALSLIPFRTSASAQETILMASTIGPIDAGIVGALEDAFENETGIRVRHVGAGTGEALKIAEQGNVDLVMVHAKDVAAGEVARNLKAKRSPK